MTSAQTAGIQVYDGDGLSESERETLSRLASEREAAAELLAASRPRGVKMKWTKEVMEDLQTSFPLDLEGELLKGMQEDVQKDKAIWTEDMLKVFGLTKEMLK